MIEFIGELNGVTKKYALKLYSNMMLRSAIFATLVFGVPVTIFAITAYLPMFLFLLILLPAWIGTFVPLNKKGQDELFPNRAFIDKEEGTIVIQCAAGEKSERFRMINSVKKVVDYGDFYQISFPFPHNDIFFVFQKDLITKGTIEEFENIFEGKIVRIEK